VCYPGECDGGVDGNREEDQGWVGRHHHRGGRVGGRASISSVWSGDDAFDRSSIVGSGECRARSDGPRSPLEIHRSDA
jgi:hypothetical protein